MKKGTTYKILFCQRGINTRYASIIQKFYVIFIFFIFTVLLFENNVLAQNGNDKWKLVWEDQFDSDELDTTKWSLINTQPGRYENSPDWKKHMIADEAVYAVDNGNLYLKGMNNPGMKQWPFDLPFYFILSQQLGGSWVGEVDPDDLPVSMIIDYVRVFSH